MDTRPRVPAPPRSRRVRLLPLLTLLPSLVGCGGGPSAAPSTPEELRGQWQTFLNSSPTYYPYDGAPPPAVTGGATLGVFYFFWPDGRYEHVWNLAMSYFDGACFYTARWRELGTVRIAGPRFTFTPTQASHSVLDSCGASSYVNPAPARIVNLDVSREQDQTGWPFLRLGLPTGEELLLEKCRDCP